MKYRSRPVVIDALLVQARYKNLSEITEFVGAENVLPIPRHLNYILRIKTAQGERSISWYDYIVKDARGECYQVKPDVFEVTYERLDERLDKPVVRKRDGNDLYLTPEALEVVDKNNETS